MSGVTRRGLLAGGLALAAAPTLAACDGVTRRVASTRQGGADRITVQTYGTDTETAVYEVLARRFEERHRGVRVELTVVPFAEASTGIDAALLAGIAPDVFRVDYPSMGVYAAAGQLLEVGPALEELMADVAPALRGAVGREGRVYGVPQHVDTSAVLYRPDVLERAGVTSVPDRLEDAWSWEELGQVADRLRDAAVDDTAPFAVNWQALGAFRWLNWLFMAGGHVYTPDLTESTLRTPEARRALEFTTSFFERGWVPTSTSTKAASFPDALFTSGRLAMLFAGNFLLPALEQTVGDRFEYAVAPLPRDARAAAELGGNALVATEQAGNPDLAATFLAFMGEPEQMRTFCEAATVLPTRRSLLDQDLEFAASPQLMDVYAAQITTLAERDVSDVTTPSFAQVNNALADELEASFLSGRDSGATLDALADQVDAAARLNRTRAGA